MVEFGYPVEQVKRLIEMERVTNIEECLDKMIMHMFVKGREDKYRCYICNEYDYKHVLRP